MSGICTHERFTGFRSQFGCGCVQESHHHPEPCHQHHEHQYHHMTGGHHDGGCCCGHVPPEEAFAAWFFALQQSVKDMLDKGHYPCHDEQGEHYQCLVRPTNIADFIYQYMLRCHERDWLALKCAELATNYDQIGLGHVDRSVNAWIEKAKAHSRFENKGRRPMLRKPYRAKFPDSNITGSLRDALN